MPAPHRVAVTKQQWDEAAAEYELGKKHGRQIARELGVSPATVTREFHRRGCRKASRVAEYVAEFLARLEVEAKEKALAKAEAKAAADAAIARFVQQFFDASERANREGEASGADLEIRRIDHELQLALREAEALAHCQERAWAD